MPLTDVGAQRASVHRATWLAGLVAFALLSTTGFSVARPAAVEAATTPLRAVVVVGPVGGSTTRYLERGERIADLAESLGMKVNRVYHPRATWANVVRVAQGANLLVYLGHGNGWPSIYPPFQTRTKDGMGLNPYEGASKYTTKYYGEGPIGETIRLAKNAIVLLNHLCYASGNAEEGHPIPTRSVAIQRVDNFAAGFLKTNARAVFAYGHEYVTNVISALVKTEKTLDGIFMTPNGTKGFNGSRDFYVDSVRTPGKRLHLDPYPSGGYLRAVSGDLKMTTKDFRGETPTDAPANLGDTSAPSLASLDAVGRRSVPGIHENALPLFTPNGDGRAETVSVRYSGLSEDAYLDVAVIRAGGSTVRTFSRWSTTASGAIRWAGRTQTGRIAPDGVYTVRLTPRDKAGNRGRSRSTRVLLLTSLSAPDAAPRLFYARDRDSLARRSALSVTLRRSAAFSWKVVDARGALVARRYLGRPTAAGRHTWLWDGKDTTGAFAPDGVYRSVTTATTAAGAYSETTLFRLGAFRIRTSTSSPRRGTAVTIRLVSAEPLSRLPTITLRQSGTAAYTVEAEKTGTHLFRARLRLPSGGSAGTLRLTATAVDRYGQRQSASTVLPLR